MYNSNPFQAFSVFPLSDTAKEFYKQNKDRCPWFFESLVESLLPVAEGSDNTKNKMEPKSYPEKTLHISRNAEENEYVIQIMTPGVHKNDIKVFTEENKLHVDFYLGEESKNNGALKFSGFYKNMVLDLPDDIENEDSPSASLNSGILTIKFNLRKKQETKKTIEIQ